MSDGNRSQQPSLAGGHVQYAKGAAESAIGSVTGSQPWKSSGEQDKAAGMAAMHEAGERRDPSHGYGRVEEMAGRVAGCEGMQKEGAASKPKNE